MNVQEQDDVRYKILERKYTASAVVIHRNLPYLEAVGKFNDIVTERKARQSSNSTKHARLAYYNGVDCCVILKKHEDNQPV